MMIVIEARAARVARNAGGGNRTHTGGPDQRILSPQRLPFRHAGRPLIGRYVDGSQAARSQVAMGARGFRCFLRAGNRHKDRPPTKRGELHDGAFRLSDTHLPRGFQTRMARG